MAITKLSSGSSFTNLTKYDSFLAGNPYFQPTAYESISTVTVGSGGATSLTFTSIPSTYTHLQIRGMTVNASNNYTINLRFNGDTASNYSAHQLYSTGAAAGAGGDANFDHIYIGVGAKSTSLYSGGIIIDILDYANTNKYKTARGISGGDGNGSGQTKFASGNWRSTSAITSIYIDADGSTFNQYATFALYGIKGS
jgi:hypothetical protein